MNSVTGNMCLLPDEEDVGVQNRSACVSSPSAHAPSGSTKRKRLTPNQEAGLGRRSNFARGAISENIEAVASDNTHASTFSTSTSTSPGAAVNSTIALATAPTHSTHPLSTVTDLDILAQVRSIFLFSI